MKLSILPPHSSEQILSSRCTHTCTISIYFLDLTSFAGYRLDRLQVAVTLMYLKYVSNGISYRVTNVYMCLELFLRSGSVVCK